MLQNKQANILLVEDEENLHLTMKLNMEMAAYSVTSAYTGGQALDALKNEYFDLVILDIMLPEIDGITIAETIRIQNLETPILMVSAKDTPADRVLGLRKGADDYLVKPFNLEELMLRIEKLIIKNKKINERESVTNLYNFGANTVDFNTLEAKNKDGEIFTLSKKEIMLLKLLFENKNEIVSREKILQAVWGYQVYPNTRTIDNFILNFRKYFETDSRNPTYFLSVRGIGYKFCI
jgi:two-component system, OmpR family, alkaline phosphatase synthesis response regulator PhoP